MAIVELQTTSYCNASCYFCPNLGDNWNKSNPGVMSEELFLNIISRHPKIERLCMFLSNEPFLDKRLLSLMDKANKISKIDSFLISTNASYIPSDIEQLKYFPYELWVSFHGADKKSYEKTMGLNYENAVRNIKYLDELGIVFQFRGAGFNRKTGEVLFNEKDYVQQILDFKLSQPLNYYYYSFHDRAGSSKNIDFKHENDDFSCVRYGEWYHYDHTGFEVLCCMAYNHEPRGSRELCKKCCSKGG